LGERPKRLAELRWAGWSDAAHKAGIDGFFAVDGVEGHCPCGELDNNKPKRVDITGDVNRGMREARCTGLCDGGGVESFRRSPAVENAMASNFGVEVGETWFT
jgi:hypothetical protein